MPAITPFLWFDNTAGEAARFYTSIFPNSRLLDESPLVVTFEIEGQRVMAINGGPHFQLNEAFSFFVACDSQAEVDRYWDALLADGGTPSQCGWLTDRFGLTWQIIPTRLMELMSDPDPERAQRVTQAMLGMVKIDVAALEAAHAG
jgi:predicted 3-demethylubiquinone-9 3-methyltransferase (glyoxalase superfamily)